MNSTQQFLHQVKFNVIIFLSHVKILIVKLKVKILKTTVVIYICLYSKYFSKLLGLRWPQELGWEFLCDFERPSRFLSEKISNKKKCYLRRGCGWKIYFAQLCLNLIFRKLTVCWNKSIQMNLIIHFILKIENIWFSREK